MASLTRFFGAHAGFVCSVPHAISIAALVASSTLAPFTVHASPLPKKDEAKKISQLENELKKKQALIDDLREKNLVLTAKIEQERKAKIKNSTQPVPFDPSAAQSVAAETETQAALGAAPSLTWPATAEYMLYSKVIDSYEKRRIPDLERSTQLLLKGYPHSVFGDNALYLQSRLQVSTGAYQQALDSIERIETLFPDGDKKVSALFLKGEIFEHMKQAARAQDIFKLVARDFPGSPESLQILDRQLAQGDKH